MLKRGKIILFQKAFVFLCEFNGVLQINHLSKTEDVKTFFTEFIADITAIDLPDKFTFPFYYRPHELAKIAATELQAYLKTQDDWTHNFGIDPTADGMVIGKMFGVLVVQNREKKLGYLAAVSGKLAGKNDHDRFVPPVFDMLTADGFFHQEAQVLNKMNDEVERLENSPAFLDFQNHYATEHKKLTELLENARLAQVEGRKNRKSRREAAQLSLSNEALDHFESQLVKESLHQKHLYKQFCTEKKKELHTLELEMKQRIDRIKQLKADRKKYSNDLQQRLFDQYSFLNTEGNVKRLTELFDGIPPSGAGECAAPKLLQHAFQEGYTPVALAEFWWGASPKSEIRKHGFYYPACHGKCKPILTHMLSGMEVDENPMLKNPAEGKTLPIVFEDAHLLVVNKPAEFLSVPGKTIKDCVYERIKKEYPHASGPLIVHRLDMSTSGLLLIAKSLEIHKELQKQFIERTIKKRYVALLEGTLAEDYGTVELPLRVDLDDRPRQLVCAEHGKHAKTVWRVLERKDNRTKVHFVPITGRTHQLRVHAAHALGLDAPIVGDDLYGAPSDRLYLHAELLEFTHPVTKKTLKIHVSPDF